MSSPTQAVLFDWAYTLVDLVDEDDRAPLKKVFDHLAAKEVTLPDFDTAYQACHDIFYKMIAVSRESGLEARFEVALQSLFFRYNISLNGVATLRELLALYYEDIYAQRRVYPETVAALEALKGRGLRLGIVSNTTNPGYMKDREQQMLGLSHYFEFSIYSSEAPFRKPHSSIFHLAIDRLGLPAGRILFVGDNPAADIAGAQGVGMQTAWINRDHQPVPDGLKPDHVIHSLAEVPELVHPA
ncbi:HAD family hydrolase [Nitrospina watsonii]|uniref:(S)-2-haloacid dehalogenase n=1 Tax=Nitrospina watsonii TaxID=1323948 RepID=A0ABM9HE81_9BACT|nr:HAD family hydrolase [Nitrospina watsonii]CAI2718504.1 Putative (S)-2-haloacid dehalogenase [Nitrospina watsonii]